MPTLTNKYRLDSNNNIETKIYLNRGVSMGNINDKKKSSKSKSKPNNKKTTKKNVDTQHS